MAEVVWSEPALSDLDTLCRFIERDSVRAANSVARRVFRATARLADFPTSGRVVPEAGLEELREVILGSYRVMYHYSGRAVEILAVIHAARQLGKSET